MQLVACASAEDLALRCADRIAALLARRSEPVLLLPAGRTPIPLYEELVRRQKDGVLDLSRAHLFQLDELVGVEPADPRSFQRFLRQHLVDPAGLSEARLHLLDGASPDPEGEIARHGASLAALGGGDLAVLGLGTNGHVAFNEPGSRATDGARRVRLATATREGLRSAFSPAAPPVEGITLGIAELLACEAIDLLVLGSSKAGVLKELLSGSSSLPASLLGTHADLHIFADDAARASVLAS